METIKSVLNTAQNVATTVVQNISQDPKSKDLGQYRVHEIDQNRQNVLTTNFGTPLSNDDDSLKGGERGPTLLEDFHLREKITHFDHERIPERVVHARGAGAHGYFELYESQEEITKADFLCNTTKKTPVFVRFSTVLGFRGSADLPRDVRGFAVKFYTDEGNFDMVGNNMPVFFIQDAIKFPDIIHAGKPEPHNEIPQAATAHDNFWDFISRTTESAHHIMWALSDRAIPRSYSTMEGFGVHSFIMVNKLGKRRFVKFHFKPVKGVQSVVWDEAQKINGVDPDFHRRDLFDSIEQGNFFEYELGLQVVDEEDEHKFNFDLLDATKIIPEELVPVKKVGKIVLNRNVDNYFAETEQVAYCTQHLVPGIEASNDPLLQGRMFSYLDTQITRLGGPNFELIPINKPICPVINNQRDGMHQTSIHTSKVNYYPNRFGCPALDKIRGYSNSATTVHGVKIRAKGPKFSDHYSQARLFYNSLSSWEKKHLQDASVFELGRVDDVEVRQRIVEMFSHIDYDLAKNLAYGIGVDEPVRDNSAAATHKDKSVAVSMDKKFPPESIKGKRIAFLVGNGFKDSQLTPLKLAFTSLGASCFIVGPRKAKIVSDDPAISQNAQFTFTTCKSVIFDAVVIVGGIESINYMKTVGEARMFVNEMFKHCKCISALGEGVQYLETFGFPGVQLSNGSENVSDQGVVTLRSVGDFNLDLKIGYGKALHDAVVDYRFFTRDIAMIPA